LRTSRAIERRGSSLTLAMKTKIFLLFAALALTLARGSDEIRSGPLAGVDLDKVPSDLRSVLRMANEDCVAIEGFRAPFHAKPSDLARRDGGTREYFGDRYRIVWRKTLFSTGAILGYSYGYELYLGPAAERAGAEVTVSKVWYVSSDVVDSAQNDERKKG